MVFGSNKEKGFYTYPCLRRALRRCPPGKLKDFALGALPER